MDKVLTLVAGVGREALSSSDIDLLRDVMRSAGAEPGSVGWLTPGKAADLPFDAPDQRAVGNAVREAFSRRADVAVQAEAGRRKRLLVADMESTIIEQEMLDEIAELAGLDEQIATITRRAMSGELDFEGALRERVRMLEGLSASLLTLAAERITLVEGAAVLVRTMKAHGAHTALVSGGFTVFTGAVAAELGFDEHYANRIIVAGDRISGEVESPILGREAKLHTLETLSAALGAGPEVAVAVGDGANDLAMLARAGLGVGFRPKPVLRAGVDAIVDVGDLTTLLYFQGYPASAFAQG